MFRMLRAIFEGLFPYEPPGRWQLHLADGRMIRDPQAAEIEAALAELVADPFHWVTLSRSKVEFLVFSGSAAEGFVVEREEGTRDAHYMAREAATLAEVRAIYRAYAAGNRQWVEQYTWERVPVGQIDLRKAPRVWERGPSLGG